MDFSLIQKAKELLLKDELVIFPTETVYGLGANALSSRAVQKIFEAKERPSSNPLIVHIYSPLQIPSITDELTCFQKESIEKLTSFWPGPLSLVLPASKNLAPEVLGGKNSVALRIPNHPLALQLLELLGLPLAAPSANPSTRISPTKSSHVREYFGDRFFILEGGDCKKGIESTVLSLLNDTPTLLRYGSLSKELLEETLSIPILIDTKSSHSPGTQFLHYAPRKSLQEITKERLLEDSFLKNETFYIVFTNSLYELIRAKTSKVFHLTESADSASSQLYSALFVADQSACKNIVIERCFFGEDSENSEWDAIKDRIARACAR